MREKYGFATAVVCGYSIVGTKALSALIATGVKVLALYTYNQKPDEKWFEPPAAVAKLHNIPVFFADNFNTDEVYQHIKNLNPDFLFSFYFREMIRERFLKIPRIGSYNIHGSLLPKFRGRAPINWTILHGETESGITLHEMTPKPDDGDIIVQEKFILDWDETALSLIMRIAVACDHLVPAAVTKLLGSDPKGIPQVTLGKSTYFGGRTPEDGEFDASWGAAQAFNLIRALADPWPNAFFRIRHSSSFDKVLNSAAQDKIINVCWALPTAAKCAPGQFRLTTDGVLMGMSDGALCLHALRKDGVRSERPTEHAQWLGIREK